MKEPITTLLSNGTTTSIFLAVLLTAVVVFAGWTKKLIETQLKGKDARIDKLEKDVALLQHSYKTELMDIVLETRQIMTKCIDAFNRLEFSIDKMNKR